MIEINLQIDCHTKTLRPSTEEDWENIVGKYFHNQVVATKISGPEKQRSIAENNLFHACCKIVADNTEDKNWNTKEAVKVQCKIALKFFDGIVVTGENVQFQLRSLSFTKTKQKESHEFIKNAIDLMAEKLGVLPDTLIRMAKIKMR